MRVSPTFRYATEADRCWHDKVPHPASCSLCPAFLLGAVALFMIF